MIGQLSAVLAVWALITTGLRASEGPALTVDVILDHYSVRRQAHLLPADSAEVVLAVTNHGNATVVIFGSPISERKPVAAGMEEALPPAEQFTQEQLKNDKGQEYGIRVVAEVEGAEAWELLGEAGQVMAVSRNTEVLPGTTVLVPIPLDAGLVRSGEQVTVKVTLRSAARTVAAPAFRVWRE